MTETERIELLKEVARVAPKEMGAMYVDEPENVARVVFVCVQYRFVDNDDYHRMPLLLLEGDVLDAPAIIAMLDAMEKAGKATYIESAEDDGFVCGVGHYEVIKKVRTFCSESAEIGATRAEAVARAFVEVFKAPAGGTNE